MACSAMRKRRWRHGASVTVLVASTALLMTQAAQASGPVPVGSWSGFYAGVHAGVGAFTGQTLDWDRDLFDNVDGDLDQSALDILGGIQAGYNRQIGSIVYGVEADWSWTGFSEDRLFVNRADYIGAEMDWLGTLRGRLGLAQGNVMAYVTGGLAVAHLSHCANNDEDNPCSIDNDDDIAWDGTKLGIVAGAGVEAALSERLSLKGEYLFVQMGTQNVVYNSAEDQDIDFSNRSHQLRLGLNYHFGGLPVVMDHEVSSGTWSGFYAGVHGGAGAFSGKAMDWGRQVFTDPDGDADLDAFAGIAGGQVGFNRQVGNVVYGLAADWSWTGYGEERGFDVSIGEDTAFVRAEMDWLATLRGRLGLAAGNAMAYVTGGLAVAQLGHCANDLTVSGADGQCSLGEDNIAWNGAKLGLVAGAGVEAAVSERMSVKGEYLFVQMDGESIVYDDGRDVEFSNRSHQLRLGLNYHFAGLPVTHAGDAGPWSGVYAGAHGGVGAFTGTAMDWDHGVFDDPDGDLDLNAFALLTGVQAGYNHQSGNIVYGIEGDWSWTGFDEDRTFQNRDDDRYYVRAGMDWMGTVRGRLGVASGNAMAYVTGGLAVAQLSHCGNDSGQGVAAPVDRCATGDENNIAWDGTKLGLAAGAGAEAKLTDRVSLKGEYLFVQMDKQNAVYDVPDDRDIDFSNRSHQLRVGLNYHFGRP